MSNSICNEIENDGLWAFNVITSWQLNSIFFIQTEFYQHFLSENVNETKIKNSTFSFNEQISRLQIGIDKLHSELHSQVRQQHGALLSQASQAGKLNYALNAVSEQIQSLQKGAEKLKSQVDVPYSLLENQTKVLERSVLLSVWILLTKLLHSQKYLAQITRDITQFTTDWTFPSATS